MSVYTMTHITCEFSFLIFILFLKDILLIMLLQVSQFFPLYLPSAVYTPTLQHSAPTTRLSSCLWAIHISSLTSLFAVPFLTPPHLFYAY